MSEGKDVEQDDDAMDVKHFLAEPSNDPLSIDDFFTKSPDLHVDSEFADEELECKDTPRKGLSFEKSSFETHSSEYTGSESSTAEVPESNGSKSETSHCQDHKTEKMEQKSPIIYTSQNRRKLQSRLGLIGPPSACDLDLTSFSDLHRYSEETSAVSNPRKTKQFSSARHALVRSNDSEEDKLVNFLTESSSQKRSRKPPVRYIDEFTSHVPLSDERHSICGTPMDKIRISKTSTESNNRHKTIKSSKPARHDGHYGGSPISLLASNKVVRGLSNRVDTGLSNRVAVGLSKEFSPVTRLDSDEESDSDTPDNLPRIGFKSCGDRRKHQKVWTLPEVEKLVDGISRYGVGHWTEIQRLFFPKSTSRTPVDLRDKWRNLLKASRASMQNDQEEQDEELTKNGHRQLPLEILHRISELSRLYPYPIKRTPNQKQKRAPKCRSARN